MDDRPRTVAVGNKMGSYLPCPKGLEPEFSSAN